MSEASNTQPNNAPSADDPQRDVDTFEREQSALYTKMPRYALPIARSNLKVLSSASVVSLTLLIIMLAQRCLINGFTLANIIPFALGVGVMAVSLTIARHTWTDDQAMRAAIIGTTIFTMGWYLLVFYYDTVIQPNIRCVMTAIAFVSLPCLFDSRLHNKFFVALPMFAVFICFELAFASPTLHVVNIANTGFALVIGLIIGAHKSSTAIGRLVMLDMYQAATKTAVWVSLVDFTDGSFKLLKAPSYIPDGLFKNMDESTATTTATQFIDPAYRETFLEFLDATTLTSRLKAAEGKLICIIRDCEGTWLRMTVVEQRRYHGVITSVALIIDSVDDEMRRSLEYQEQLRETALEAQRANAAKTNFLRRMSHDVRTPINAIRGELYIAEHCADDPAKQLECRQKVSTASDYLLTLVNNMLDMAKLESGTSELAHEPFDLHDLLHGLVAVSSITAETHDIAYHVQGKPENIGHGKLLGSPKHLQQLLSNLSTNVVKYNRPGGSVTVSCRELYYDNKTAWFEFMCSDTGIGMSKEFQQHMYEPFSQEERDENVTAAGSGLGLSIVHELATQMGGSIECVSEIDRGTTFYVRLPFEIDYEAMRKEEAEEHTDTDLTGKRALLVEDNQLNREIAQFILEEEGLDVECAINGRAGVDAFAAAPEGTYDIVFMDVMMPVMDGLEAARAIRSLERKDAQSVPIVAMTANAFADDIQRSHDAGMNEHLVKPIEPTRIHEALQRLLG